MTPAIRRVAQHAASAGAGAIIAIFFTRMFFPAYDEAATKYVSVVAAKLRAQYLVALDQSDDAVRKLLLGQVVVDVPMLVELLQSGSTALSDSSCDALRHLQAAQHARPGDSQEIRGLRDALGRRLLAATSVASRCATEK